MLPPALEERVRRIAEDRTSGALELALEALDAMAGAGDLGLEDTADLAGRLAEAQPAMAAVRNVAYFCVEQRREAEAGRVAYRDALKAFRRYVETSRPRAGRQLLKVIDRPVAVATLSRSSTVLEAFKLLQGRHVLRSVTVLESLPGGEGASTADHLRSEGVPVTLVPDADVEKAAKDADLVLLGADTIFRDGGVVNKVGSAALAKAAAGKPVYVVAESIKLDHLRDSTTAELPPGSLFEVVPPGLLTSLATERGVYRAGAVRTWSGP